MADKELTEEQLNWKLMEKHAGEAIKYLEECQAHFEKALKSILKLKIELRKN